MRLAVVGSVNLTKLQGVIAASIINGFISDYRPELIISGGADGIDALAELLADIALIPTKIFLPDNKRWEPDGYKARNTHIAEDCTHLLCIRTQQSTTYGSGWTADLAERLGKTVWRVII